jgi:hypothetical protein
VLEPCLKKRKDAGKSATANCASGSSITVSEATKRQARGRVLDREHLGRPEAMMCCPAGQIGHTKSNQARSTSEAAELSLHHSHGCSGGNPRIKLLLTT